MSNNCLLCDIHINNTSYITYHCIECDQFTPYCYKCNNYMHKILESKFFKCNYCLSLHVVRYTKIFNLTEEYSPNTIFSNNQQLSISTNPNTVQELRQRTPFIFSSDFTNQKNKEYSQSILKECSSNNPFIKKTDDYSSKSGSNLFPNNTYFKFNESVDNENKEEFSLNQELSLRKKKHFQYNNPIKHPYHQTYSKNTQFSSNSLNFTNFQPRTSYFNNTSSPEKYKLNYISRKKAVHFDNLSPLVSRRIDFEQSIFDSQLKTTTENLHQVLNSNKIQKNNK